MFSRRVLHLARLTMLCLVLVSFALLYWQTARGSELNPVALRPVGNDPVNDPDQNNQAFVTGVSQALDLEQYQWFVEFVPP